MFMSIKNVHVKMRKWRYKMFMSNQNVDVQFNLTPFTVTKMSKLTVTDVAAAAASCPGCDVLAP